MVTVLMAILIFLGIGWQFAFEQWVNALASDKLVGHAFTLPLSCSVYAYSICHVGSAPGAVGIVDGKAYDAGWTDTPVWIIAIGSM